MMRILVKFKVRQAIPMVRKASLIRTTWIGGGQESKLPHGSFPPNCIQRTSVVWKVLDLTGSNDASA